MKSKFSGIKKMLTRDEMKKVKGGSGGYCGMACIVSGQCIPGPCATCSGGGNIFEPGFCY